VVKLKEPLSFALGYLAYSSSGFLLMLPKETDSTFDIRSDMIGTGPWYVSNYTPSVGFTLKRNQEHYDKDWAFVEQIDKPIISENANILGQLKAGNIYTYGSKDAIPQADILATKREQPALLLYRGDSRGSARVTGSGGFGWLPEGRSPFLDERVRQAISMSFDRDLFIDTFGDVASFEAEGLPKDKYWNTAIGPGAEGLWLDPQGKEFGPNAKYFEHNLAEGKKLLAAAGYPNGFEATSHYVTGTQLGSTRDEEVKNGFIQELGITVRVEPIDYAKDYIPNFRDGKGQYDGWAYMTSSAIIDGGHPVGGLAAIYWSKGGDPAFRGFSLTGRNDLSGDPQLDQLIEKARLELDTDRQQALVFDIQRYLAKAVYNFPETGGAENYTVAWPCVRNFNVYQKPAFANTWQNYRLWIDETQPPFRSA
jgi:peptide/nickel transport system substrate-binding protein